MPLSLLLVKWSVIMKLIFLLLHWKQGCRPLSSPHTLLLLSSPPPPTPPAAANGCLVVSLRASIGSHACAHTLTHVHTHSHTCTHTHTRVHTHSHMHTHSRAHICTYIHTWWCVYTCTYTCLYWFSLHTALQASYWYIGHRLAVFHRVHSLRSQLLLPTSAVSHAIFGTTI